MRPTAIPTSFSRLLLFYLLPPEASCARRPDPFPGNDREKPLALSHRKLNLLVTFCGGYQANLHCQQLFPDDAGAGHQHYESNVA